MSEEKVEGVVEKTGDKIVNDKLHEMIEEVKRVYKLGNVVVGDYLQGQLDLIEEELRLVIGNFIGDNS